MYEQIILMLNTLATIQQEMTRLQDNWEAERQAALSEYVRKRLQALEEQFKPQIDAMGLEANQITNQIKEATQILGSSVGGKTLMAIYNSGRVSWDDAFLQGYAAAHEEILQGRKEGKPSVSIRKKPST